MTKRLKIINVRLTDGELLMIHALSKKYGDISLSDVMRRCVQERYGRVFPVYLEKSGYIKPLKVPEQQLTDEQYCESVGGKVGGGTEGNTVCFIAKPGTQNGYKFPISERKRIKECAENFGLI